MLSGVENTARIILYPLYQNTVYSIHFYRESGRGVYSNMTKREHKNIMKIKSQVLKKVQNEEVF